MSGKLLNIYFNLSLFTNPGEKVLILVESRGTICPLSVILFRTFSPRLENNNTLKWISDKFSRNPDKCVDPGKLLKLYFNVSLFSNPGENVLIIIGISCSLYLRV